MYVKAGSEVNVGKYKVQVSHSDLKIATSKFNPKWGGGNSAMNKHPTQGGVEILRVA